MAFLYTKMDAVHYIALDGARSHHFKEHILDYLMELGWQLLKEMAKHIITYVK
jgi:hypothetical protein